MENITTTATADAQRINLHESHDLMYWAEKLNVSTGQLAEAVNAVGPGIDIVEVYLDRNS